MQVDRRHQPDLPEDMRPRSTTSKAETRQRKQHTEGEASERIVVAAVCVSHRLTFLATVKLRQCSMGTSGRRGIFNRRDDSKDHGETERNRKQGENGTGGHGKTPHSISSH